MSKTSKDEVTKKNLDELKDRKIEDDLLEEVSGGEESAKPKDIDVQELFGVANAKRTKGGLASAIKR